MMITDRLGQTRVLSICLDMTRTPGRIHCPIDVEIRAKA